jgi:elongation factor Tu
MECSRSQGAHPALLWERARRSDAADPGARAPGPELVDLVEAEVRELLTQHGYNGEAAAVVRLSALRALEGDPAEVANVRRLIAAVDAAVAAPALIDDRPFLMPIAGVHSVPGLGTVVAGVVERGRLRAGAPVELVGLEAAPLSDVVRGIESSHRTVDEAITGDSIGLLLRRARRDDVRRGQVVAASGSVAARRRFLAEVYVTEAAEGGRRRHRHRPARRRRDVPARRPRRGRGRARLAGRARGAARVRGP